MTSTPPGWYAGGTTGEERWWDGVAWTAYARPAAPPMTVVPRTSTFWSGSKDGSLVAAILCAVLTIPSLLATVFALLSGSIMFLAPGLAFCVFVAFAIIMFLNWRGLSSNERIRREQGTMVQPTPPAGS